jgi:type I restriction enzyme, S subunit
MKTWKEVKFADLLIESRDGEWGNGEASVGHLLSEVIRGTDFAEINSPEKEFPKRWIKDHLVERKKLQTGDILLETAGGTAKQSTGRSAILRQSFFDIHKDNPVLCASFSRYLRLDKENFSPEFIYYLLQVLYNSGFMSVYNLQHTGVSRFQYTSFKNRTILKIPKLEFQKKIAAILSAYDDLIENNDRRITLLEKMAEEIYREWFVRLRFPGYEQATFHKGIPEGWEIKDLKDAGISILDGDRGSNYPSKDEFSETGYCLFLNTGNIKDDKFDFSRNDFIAEQKDSILRKGKLMFNDIILTTRGTVGSIAFYSKNLMYQNVRINSGMVILRPKNGEDEALYYYCLLKSSLLKDQYRSYSSGSAQPQLPIKDLRRINVLIPPAKITKQFCNLAGIFIDRLDLLQLANWNLKQTRDRLLTRLISGKLSVEDLDIQFPPSMTEELEAKQT